MKASTRNYRRVKRGLPKSNRQLRRDAVKQIRYTLAALAKRKGIAG